MILSIGLAIGVVFMAGCFVGIALVRHIETRGFKRRRFVSEKAAIILLKMIEPGPHDYPPSCDVSVSRRAIERAVVLSDELEKANLHPWATGS